MSSAWTLKRLGTPIKQTICREIKSQADLYAKAIIAGDIYVPKNREQFTMNLKYPKTGYCEYVCKVYANRKTTFNFLCVRV